MSLTNSRFYEEKYPEVDSFVMVNVKQVRVVQISSDRKIGLCVVLDCRNGCLREVAGIR
jgi:hypothetical protein